MLNMASNGTAAQQYDGTESQCAETKIFAKKFVERLLEEGRETPCDETSENFEECGSVPPFYDEEKFKRGQQFFHKHIFGMFLGKLLGLLSVLALPSVLKLLMYTNMSSTPLTAYKRYLQTVYHMCVWYNEDFRPGTKLWKSFDEVRNKHNSASKKGCKAGLGRISQKDMALTQFGFMGFIMVKTEMMGIYNATREEMEALVHVWRVVGYVLGMEDRFNICRESLEETQEICKLLLEDVIRPQIVRRDPDFIQMASALINGMWCMNPALQVNVFLGYLVYVISPCADRMRAALDYAKMNAFQRVHFGVILGGIYLLRYNAARVFFNMLKKLTIWLMPRCPFLAYACFGYRNAQFSFMTSDDRKNG